MLYDTEDLIVIDILGRLLVVESEDDMNSGFEELERLYEVRKREFDKAVNKERQEHDVPRRVGEGTLEAVAAEWGMEMPVRKPSPAEGDQ